MIVIFSAYRKVKVQPGHSFSGRGIMAGRQTGSGLETQDGGFSDDGVFKDEMTGTSIENLVVVDKIEYFRVEEAGRRLLAGCEHEVNIPVISQPIGVFHRGQYWLVVALVGFQ